MRLFLAALVAAAPALADTIEVAAPVTAVTLYPQGATVTRTAAFTAPAGTHELIVPGLPAGLAAEDLRVTAPDGVSVGAVSLVSGRPPATADRTPEAVKAAEAEVRRIEALLRDRRRAIAAIRARGQAAEARAAFLQSLARAEAEDRLAAAAVEHLRAIAALVGEEVLAARETALAAEDEAITAEIALQPEIEAYQRAQAALAALQAPEGDSQTLLLTVATAADGPAEVSVAGLTDDAGWTPVYDLRLTRGPGALTLARGVLVSQYTGEDWTGVELTLSTARPSEQNAPSALWPDLRSLVPEAPPLPAAPADNVLAGAPPAPQAEMVADAAPDRFAFEAATAGAVFTFRFGAPVDIRTGTDALRLAMDELPLDVEVTAEAVPMFDETAFLVANLTNATGQPILPGSAMLYAEGTLVGAADLPLVPAQGEARIGFGPIDGLRLTRIVPDRSEGEEGVFTTSNRREETAVLTVENLTGETWPVRLTDRVPYSEQDDLEIEWDAQPAPAEESPEGQRGLLVWTFDIEPGATREIRLETRLAWPDGMVLQ
jgi:uncharacterized protein (TIGR02231 family)